MSEGLHLFAHTLLRRQVLDGANQNSYVLVFFVRVCVYACVCFFACVRVCLCARVRVFAHTLLRRQVLDGANQNWSTSATGRFSKN